MLVAAHCPGDVGILAQWSALNVSHEQADKYG
jgi:hypothetical protein